MWSGDGGKAGGTDTSELAFRIRSGGYVLFIIMEYLRWNTVDQRGPRHSPSIIICFIKQINTQANKILKSGTNNVAESPTAMAPILGWRALRV